MRLRDLTTSLVPAFVASWLLALTPSVAFGYSAQAKRVTGPVVNASTWNRDCHKYAGGDFYYYFSYTDSVYQPVDRYYYFIFLGSSEGEPEEYSFKATIVTTLRGLAVRSTSNPAVGSCQGSTTSTEFAPKVETQTSGAGAWTFQELTYAEYVAIANSIGLAPVGPGIPKYGYVMVDLGVAAGSDSVSDVSTAICSPTSCPIMESPINGPYASSKTITNMAVVRTVPELCNGVDDNGNGRVEETCRACTGNSVEIGSRCDLASGILSQSLPLLRSFGGPMPLDLTVAYNSRDTEVGALGKGWTHSYEVRLRDDNEVSLALVDGAGRWQMYRKESLSSSPHGFTTYVPYEDGFGSARRERIEKVSGGYELGWPDGRLWRFDASGRLTEMRDAKGNTVQLTYTGTRLSQVRDPGGRTLTFAYNADGRIQTITDSASRVVSFTYEAGTQHLLQIVEANTGTWTFTYGTDGRMLTKTDPRGGLTQYGYSTGGTLTQVTDPGGEVRTIAYNRPAGFSRVSFGGTSIGYTWDKRLNVPLQLTDPTGRNTQYTYDTVGRLLTRTDNAGHTWTYTYDTAGRLASETDPLLRTVSFTYDGTSDRIATRTEPGGVVTHFDYDAQGNLTGVTDPTSRVTTFGYDTRGNLTSITDPAGQTTVLTYDTQNLLTSTTDPTGVALTYAYDAVGRLATVTDEAGGTTSYTYNALDRLTDIVDPLTHTTEFGYGPMGDQMSRTDALSRVSQFVYDARGLLTSTTDPAGGVTSYAYDLQRRLTSLTDAENRTTSWTYDGAGRELTETDSLNDVTTYAYDPRGLLQFTTTPRSHVLERRYDAVGRLTERLGPGGLAETYTYDLNGRLATATGGGVTYTYAYDLAGRVTSVSDSRGYVVSYTYDAAGRRQTLVYPGGQVLAYGYDLAGRLTSLTDGPRVLGLGYDAVGRRASLTYPNGMQTTYSYDLASRLTGITHATSGSVPLQTFTYGLDAADSRTSLTTVDQDLGFGYDLANRLTGVTATPAAPLPAEAFAYDGVGNRLAGPDPGDAYTYTAGHQLLTGPGASYTYDASGNRTTKMDATGTTTYTSDAFERLVEAVVTTGSGTTTVTFTYDALGRRIAKTVVTTPTSGPVVTATTASVYDGEDIIWEAVTTDASGAPVTTTTRYVHGPGIDEPLLLETGGQVLAVHADGLGSVTALSDASQTLAEERVYTAFGQLQRSGTWPGVAYAYTGREWEPELGLYYYRARYYDPEAGRFLSRDPIGFDGGDSNLYAYVASDPANLVDSYGESGSRPGGPYHPPSGVKTRCTGFDSCSTLSGKIWLLQRMISSHVGWDEHMQAPRGGTRHAAEIRQLQLQLSNCLRIYNQRCTGQTPNSCCDETAQTAAKAAGVAVAGYVAYRCVRMLPSLVPPLWPTIPANLAMP